MLPGSGPYIVNESDVVRGNSITIRRRNDYWAENTDATSVSTTSTRFRKSSSVTRTSPSKCSSAGPDYTVADPRQWVQEMNFDRIQTGLFKAEGLQ